MHEDARTVGYTYFSPNVHVSLDRKKNLRNLYARPFFFCLTCKSQGSGIPWSASNLLLNNRYVLLFL